MRPHPFPLAVLAALTAVLSLLILTQPKQVVRVTKAQPSPQPLRSPVAPPKPRPAVVVRRPAPKPRIVVRQAPRPVSAKGLVSMSWYAEGTGTASGEPFNPGALTCAAAYRFRLGTYLTLRNPRTGATARVRLNDRGAFEGMGRSLDCTPAVWRALGYPLSAGVVRVQIL